MTSAGIVPSAAERVAPRQLPAAALIGGLIAAVANTIVLFVAQALGTPLQIAMDPSAPAAPLTIVPVVLASALPAIGAGVLLWLLGRFTRRPFTIFLAIAGVFLLLSLGGPLSMPVPGATKAVLSLMHVVAGASIAGALFVRARER
jgi:hypothetical protein